MIKRKFIISILASGLLWSCSDDLLEQKALTEDVPEEAVVETNKHLITVDKAISNLENFLGSFNGKSRSGDRRVIKDFCTIKARQTPLGRSEDLADLDCENLLYIVNFEDEQGYAVLAADDRIGEDILAITDIGNYDSTAVAPPVPTLIDPERIIIPEYPTTGDGFYKLMEYGDTLFINPNTVDFAIPAEQDTLVGNFFLDHIGSEDDFGNPTDDPANDSINYNRTIEYTTTALCIDYACDQILSSQVTLPKTDDNNLDPTVGSGENGGPVSNGGAYGDAELEYWYSDWEITNSVSPMLESFKSWHQGSPFNDLYPKRRLAILFGHKRKAPAGCFPLAIAKVMAYHKFPQSYTHNGLKINWNCFQYGNPSDDQAAHLLKAISSGCGSMYFYQGTFTLQHQASRYMRRIGFSDAHNHSYTWDRIVRSLGNGCPLVISGLPGFNIFKAHAWNIDGYKLVERNKKTIIKRSPTDVTAIDTKETKKMIHCDFGWKGKNNGYYISGVFKSNSKEIEYDPSIYNPGKIKYTRMIRIITYSKPN